MEDRGDVQDVQIVVELRRDRRLEVQHVGEPSHRRALGALDGAADRREAALHLADDEDVLLEVLVARAEIRLGVRIRRGRGPREGLGAHDATPKAEEALGCGPDEGGFPEAKREGGATAEATRQPARDGRRLDLPFEGDLGAPRGDDLLEAPRDDRVDDPANVRFERRRILMDHGPDDGRGSRGDGMAEGVGDPIELPERAGLGLPVERSGDRREGQARARGAARVGPPRQREDRVAEALPGARAARARREREPAVEPGGTAAADDRNAVVEGASAVADDGEALGTRGFDARRFTQAADLLLSR